MKKISTLLLILCAASLVAGVFLKTAYVPLAMIIASVVVRAVIIPVKQRSWAF